MSVELRHLQDFGGWQQNMLRAAEDPEREYTACPGFGSPGVVLWQGRQSYWEIVMRGEFSTFAAGLI